MKHNIITDSSNNIHVPSAKEASSHTPVLSFTPPSPVPGGALRGERCWNGCMPLAIHLEGTVAKRGTYFSLLEMIYKKTVTPCHPTFSTSPSSKLEWVLNLV